MLSEQLNELRNAQKSKWANSMQFVSRVSLFIHQQADGLQNRDFKTRAVDLATGLGCRFGIRPHWDRAIAPAAMFHTDN